MSRRERRISRWIDDLIRDRKPRRLRGAQQEKDVLAAAVEMRSASAGAGLPDPRFVESLRQRIARETQGEVARAPRLSRRTLLASGGLAAATAAAGLILGERFASAPAPPGELTPEGGRWVAVADVAEVPAGTAKMFDNGSVRGLVVNNAGTFAALSAVCTHQGCLLRLNANAKRLDCPCHRAAFAWDGSVLFKQMPDALPSLPRLAARVNEHKIEVLAV